MAKKIHFYMNVNLPIKYIKVFAVSRSQQYSSLLFFNGQSGSSSSSRNFLTDDAFSKSVLDKLACILIDCAPDALGSFSLFVAV